MEINYQSMDASDTNIYQYMLHVYEKYIELANIYDIS